LALAERARERDEPDDHRARPGGLLELEAGDQSWPTALEFVFTEPTATAPFGRPGEPTELGRSACSPAPEPGAPWRRVGARPPRAAGSVLVTLVDPATGAAHGRWALPAGRPAEGTAEERSILHWPAPGRSAAARAVGPHPAAPWLMGIGALVLLSSHLPRRVRWTVFRAGGASPLAREPISSA
jgi:hypothetical protein